MYTYNPSLRHAHLCGIVQAAESRREGEVSVWHYLWSLPTSVFTPVNEQHVVGEVLAKLQCFGVWFRPGALRKSHLNALMLERKVVWGLV